MMLKELAHGAVALLVVILLVSLEYAVLSEMTGLSVRQIVLGDY